MNIITSNTGQVSFAPKTNGTNIGIGSGVGVLNISQSVLDMVQTGRLNIGNNNSGDIQIGDVVSSNRLAVTGQFVDIVGDVTVANSKRLSLTAYNTSIETTDGTLYENRVDFDAVDQIEADLEAAIVNVADLPNGFKLTGTLAGFKNFRSANAVNGGLANNINYTVNGYKIGLTSEPVAVESLIPTSVEQVVQKPRQEIFVQSETAEQRIQTNQKILEKIAQRQESQKAQNNTSSNGSNSPQGVTIVEEVTPFDGFREYRPDEDEDE